MKHVLPLRFDEISDGRFVVADDTGSAFLSTREFIERYVGDKLDDRDETFLDEAGFRMNLDTSDLAFTATLKRMCARFANPSALNYLIVVPSLRCDLKCSYCQVSRVDEHRMGFDWSDDQVAKVLSFIDGLTTDNIQIEFQGGEPLLRPDILNHVMDFCRGRFDQSRFVICTNLSRLDEAIKALIAAPDVFISTSLDGSKALHQKNRTKNEGMTEAFFANLRAVIDEFGIDKVSALPTIDYTASPSPEEILDAYDAFGLRSIYLRPVNHQGFARKAFSALRNDAVGWSAYYERFIDAILKRNADSDQLFEEFTLTLAIKRCLQTGHDTHVDFRNPSFVATDYIVVDFDGRLYPTDEARMLTRSGVVDLSIGDVEAGITNQETIDQLHSVSVNNLDPDCQHCAFQPACGSDPIDDLSRYGRVDLPRPHTVYCRRQTALFRLAWRLIASNEPHIRRSVCAWLDIPYTLAPLVPAHD